MWLPHLYYVIVHSGVCCNVVYMVWHMFHSVQILYHVKHMVFPTVLNDWCLVPGFGTWFIDLTAQNTLMISALAWCMQFGTEMCTAF